MSHLRATAREARKSPSFVTGFFAPGILAAINIVIPIMRTLLLVQPLRSTAASTSASAIEEKRIRIMGKWVCLAKLGLIAYAMWMSPAAAFSPPNDLMIQGKPYPNACSETELRRSKASLAEKTPPQAMQAWRAIQMLLCAPVNSANVHVVTKLLTRRVNSTVEGTGSEPEFQKVVGNAELAQKLMADGRAWDVSLIVDQSEIKVQYAPNEACIAGITLENLRGTWRITAFGEACD